MLSNELLIESYAGAVLTAVMGDCIISTDQAWADVYDLKDEILKRMQISEEGGD